jgi:carbon-monoxide dehydrogenase medium subunit
MYDFEFHKPISIQEASQIVAENEDAKFIAGGMTLLPTMKMRLASPTDLIDLSNIQELYGLCDAGDTVEIGAMTTHAEIAVSELVREAIPALANLANRIGDAQVRNRGTIGGSLSNSDPAADYPAAVLGLDAIVKTDRRQIAADEFFVSMFETALEPAEIIESVTFRKPARAAYSKFPNPASRYAVVGVMVSDIGENIRVAVTGAGPCAFRSAILETALSENVSPDALNGITIDADGFNEDLFASAEYRAHLVVAMAKRAVAGIGA